MTIAVEALATCLSERAAYWRQLVIDGGDRLKVDEQVGKMDGTAGRMAIELVDRSRVTRAAGSGEATKRRRHARSSRPPQY